MKKPRRARVAVGERQRADPCEIFHKFALQPPEPLLILAGTVRHMAACSSFFALALASCGPRITDENLKVVDEQRIKLEELGKGLSPKEVESILGQPTRAETRRLPLETQKKEVDVVRYYYEQDGKSVELHFVDNKLINEVPRFGGKVMTPPAK